MKLVLSALSVLALATIAPNISALATTFGEQIGQNPQGMTNSSQDYDHQNTQDMMLSRDQGYCSNQSIAACYPAS
jgi:hypothetical protein